MLDPDPSQTWGYYKNLSSGNEGDAFGDDWYSAGELGIASLNDADSMQRLHQHLDSFNQVLQENPGDRRYIFIAIPTKVRVTPDNLNDEVDLIIMIQPCADDVTFDDLANFTNKVKSV